MLNLSQKNKLTDLGLSIIGFMLVTELIFRQPGIANALYRFVNVTGVWSWIGIGLLQFLQVVFIPMPATFITLMAMKMYPNNLYLLFGVTLCSVLIGTIVAYFIGYKWGKKAVAWCAGSEDEYDKWKTYLKSKKTNFAYFMTILLPIFPDDILCIIAGSIRMNLGWYLFCNVVGRTIGLITFMFFFTSIGDNLGTIIVLSIIFVMLIVYKIIIKRRLKNELDVNR